MKENNYNIIVIGYGSIGKRHYKNLQSMGYKNISVYESNPQVREEAKEVRFVDELDNQTLKGFDVAFICSPNHVHVDTALLCAKAGCHVFVEKPLSHSLENVDSLISICKEKNLTNMVACNIRFHSGPAFVKKYLESGKLGKIYRIEVEFGQYLPYWRPGQDYRQNYAAKKETGGGIILDDIHSFDLLFWLNDFVEVQASKFLYDHMSNLEIETEDMCIASFQFANQVLGLVQVDYLQQSYVWRCKVVGENGNVEWNFGENKVVLFDNKGDEVLFNEGRYDINQMYINEVRYFFDCVENNITPENDFQRSAHVLKYCIERK